MIIFIFLTTLFWSLSIPIWHFPDEQAHFAQVQYYAEKSRMPLHGEDLSYEIYESERLLGTLRDHFGINLYTYRPNYNIAYSQTTTGLDEEYINSLPKSSRTQYVKYEAARYPPLFYYIVGLGYRLFYNQGLFARVFATRIVSSVFAILTAYGAMLIARFIFPKNKPIQYSTFLAVGLHPMLTFVNAGINNDALLNCLSTYLIYYCLKLSFEPIKLKTLIIAILFFLLGIFTKQLMYLFAPVIFISILINSISYKKFSLKILSFLFIPILVIILGMAILKSLNEGFWLPYWPSTIRSGQSNFTPLPQLLTQKFSQLYRETFVWYWGVYRWLSLVLPIPLLRLIKVFIILSLVGYAKLRDIKVAKKLLFLGLVNVVYVGLILTWDLSQIRTFGFSHGIQGRYFFPLISTHMLFIIYGWYLLLPKKLKNLLLPTTLILFLSLNYYSLYRVLSSYYQNLNQLSQYKPLLAKWPYIGVYIGGYLLFIIFYGIKKLKKTNRWHLRLWRSR